MPQSILPAAGDSKGKNGDDGASRSTSHGQGKFPADSRAVLSLAGTGHYDAAIEPKVGATKELVG
jgi:hypothetical protein